MPLDNTYAQKFAEKSRRLTSLAEDYPGEDAPFRQRLHLLFSQIEKEFELVFLENLSRKLLQKGRMNKKNSLKTMRIPNCDNLIILKLTHILLLVI